MKETFTRILRHDSKTIGYMVASVLLAIIVLLCIVYFNVRIVGADLRFAFLAMITSSVALFIIVSRLGHAVDRNSLHSLRLELREQKRRYKSGLSIMHQGFCMFDEDNVVLIANERFSTIYGLAPEAIRPGCCAIDIVEMRIEHGIYIGESPQEYRDYIKKAMTDKSAIAHTHKLNDGRYIEIRVQHMPGGGWMASHELVTARIESKKQLSLQNMRFNAALESMSQGLCMLDINECVVVSNDKFAEIYDIPPDKIKPGTTLEEIVDLRLAQGVFAGESPEIYRLDCMKWGKSHRKRSIVLDLTNGRHVEVRDIPLGDGGRLTTHDDITKRFLDEQESLHRSERLNAALETMTQGFAVFDDEGAIVTSNSQYARMYDIPEEMIKPGTTIQEILQLRVDNGAWEGTRSEDYLWNRLTWLGVLEVETLTTHLNNGKTLQIRNCPLPGGGWLTHQDDISQRVALEKDLRDRGERLNGALNTMPQGFAVFDADGTLALSNDQFAQIYDVPVDQIKPGMNIEEILKLRMANGAYVGAIPQDYLDEHLGRECIYSDAIKIMTLQNGRSIEVRNNPMQDGGWLTIQADVTKRQQADKDIQHQKIDLEFALASMDHGICMFDADMQIIVSNDAFAQIYDIPIELIKPGITAEDVLDLRIIHGSWAGESPEEYRKNRIDYWSGDRNQEVITLELHNGRHVEIRNLPMVNGYWLATHHDVTSRVYFENMLANQNQRLECAIDAIPHGFAMYDNQEKLVLCNDIYATMYKLEAGSITPGMTLSDVITLRIRNGCHPGNTPQEYIEGTKQINRTVSGPARTIQLNDGRYVHIHDDPVADIGWLTLQEDVTARFESDRKIRLLADYDTLTSLPNRAQIQAILQETITHSVNANTPMALFYIDLDGFKNINDTLGHPVGDQVLREVGARLDALKSKTRIPGRLSGDEFTLIIKSFTDITELEDLGQEICASLALPIYTEHDVIEITSSVGIAIGPSADKAAETLNKHADLALYRAKHDGRNCYRLFHQDMVTDTQARLNLAADLREAIRKDELVLHYQPLVNLQTNDILGYEALIRWQHHEQGLLSPVDFIGLAETTGQICEIGEWVLTTACTYAQTWPSGEILSVNLSPVQFKRQDIVSMVKKVLWDTGLDPARLELDITEDVLMQNTNAVIVALRELSEMGISIALDDFGTGYSSLSYLAKFPFNKLKIDNCFIETLGRDDQFTALVGSIIGLGRGLDTIICAEGIETEDQRDLLRASGCNQGQGWLYGKPQSEIIIQNNQNGTLNRQSSR